MKNRGSISPLAKIGKNVNISEGVVIYDNVEIGDNTFIGPYCIIGEPTINYYKNFPDHKFESTVIGCNSIIRSFSTIYEGVKIGDNFQSGHHVVIREQNVIGTNTSFGSFSELPGNSSIGNFVRIHSKVMLSENNIIEDYVWIFPFVVLTNVKHPPIGDFKQTRIKKYAQIYANATILPGVTIGENAIIAAGTLVTKDVPDERLIIGYPGVDKKSVREIKDENGQNVYPWREHLKEYRGYPWQNKKED
ncbi:DapH/DapD/GlmU-related protein [Kaistella sp. PBT33-4]|uniref:N-acetyltransferase n=1 Tax=Kaistella sp. PBT33-4 TaxID=3032000 RepID=UPI0023D8C2D5|nr:N-acetyltransferase [Kaistella sp. PBT33-4]MDF0718774.1 DapH/DapD/GlmU-related protein [Kaistella sp. PBT33-4]